MKERSRAFTWTLPCDRKTPGRARRVIEEALDSAVPTEVLDDLRLLATELLSNAVVHDCIEPRATLKVRAERRQDSIVMEITNPSGADTTPTTETAQVEDIHGRGLHLVDQIARDWGFESNGEMTVWFELPLPE
jgi:anti-sigma regulatory factor (Ser/Thr protein kinase)